MFPVALPPTGPELASDKLRINRRRKHQFSATKRSGKELLYRYKDKVNISRSISIMSTSKKTVVLPHII